MQPGSASTNANAEESESEYSYEYDSESEDEGTMFAMRHRPVFVAKVGPSPGFQQSDRKTLQTEEEKQQEEAEKAEKAEAKRKQHYEQVASALSLHRRRRN